MGNVYVCGEYLSWLRFELLSRVRVPKTLTFITRLSSKPLKLSFICKRVKNPFRSLCNSGVRQLGNGLFIKVVLV